MVLCFVPHCSHKTGAGCRFFMFPASPKKRQKWKRLIRRADRSPKRTSRICSCHFVDGQSANGPTLFAWNAGKLFSPKSSQRKRPLPKSSRCARQLYFEEHTSSPQAESQDSETSACKQLEHEASFVVAPPPTGNVVLDEDRSNVIVVEGSLGPEATSLAERNDVVDPVTAENALLRCELNKRKEECLHGVENMILRTENERLTAENALLRSEINKIKEEFLHSRSVMHEAENTLLLTENERLTAEIKRKKDVFLFEKICDVDSLVLHYTGLPNKQTFYALLKLFNKIEIIYHQKWKVTRLNKENQLFLTLMKLRRGFSNIDLAVRFDIHRTTVSNIFISWVMALHYILVKNLMKTVPSRQKNQLHLPGCFSEYPNTRIILDCTEVSTANPTLLSNQSKMYSNYKNRITSKGLVGMAPNGAVTFVSKLYPGSTSDRTIVMKTKVLDICKPGDGVMADKGFNIEDLMPDGVVLNIPPFKDNPQFTVEQVNQTAGIARARIHVERAIARIKRFQILRYIPEFLVPYASEVFQVCAALTNFQKPLLNDQGLVDEGDDADVDD